MLYTLTLLGEALREVLKAMSKWGDALPALSRPSSPPPETRP